MSYGLPLPQVKVSDISQPMRLLGPRKSNALLFLHAFSGYDTVSSFAGRGKKTAWEIWKIYDEVSPAFYTLASNPDLKSISEQLEVLERFVLLMYNRTSTEMKVNEAWKQLFSQKSRSIDGIPPTPAALVEHMKRAAYQAGYLWAQMFVAVPNLPSPSEWGWVQTANGGLEVKWTALPEASHACRELLRCGCKSGCRNKCKCVKAVLQCTTLCKCGGLCDRAA